MPHDYDVPGDPALARLASQISSCKACPRLVRYLADSRARWPDHRCRPVPGWGDERARLLQCFFEVRCGPAVVVETGHHFIADGALDYHVGVRFDLLDAKHQGLPIAIIGIQVVDVQDQFTLLVDGHRSLEAVKALGGAFASVPHFGVGQADDAVISRALAEMGDAIRVFHHIIAQNLGQ